MPQLKQYLMKIKDFPISWNSPTETEKNKFKLTLKIRRKPKTVFGQLKSIKGSVYLIDKENKLCYGPGTKVLSID